MTEFVVKYKYMLPDEKQESIDRLARAIELAYNSPTRLFWRGVIWGIGRGVGATLGLAIVLGAGYYFLQFTGLDERFAAFLQTLDGVSKGLNSIRQ